MVTHLAFSPVMPAFTIPSLPALTLVSALVDARLQAGALMARLTIVQSPRLLTHWLHDDDARPGLRPIAPTAMLDLLRGGRQGEAHHEQAGHRRLRQQFTETILHNDITDSFPKERRQIAASRKRYVSSRRMVAFVREYIFADRGSGRWEMKMRDMTPECFSTGTYAVVRCTIPIYTGSDCRREYISWHD
jgi:hypothetical protein